MNVVLRVWSPACGGTLALTTTHVLDNYRGREAGWTHYEFIDATRDPDTMVAKIIMRTYGPEIVLEILAEIRKFLLMSPNSDGYISEG